MMSQTQSPPKPTRSPPKRKPKRKRNRNKHTHDNKRQRQSVLPELVKRLDVLQKTVKVLATHISNVHDWEASQQLPDHASAESTRDTTRSDDDDEEDDFIVVEGTDDSTDYSDYSMI